MRVLVIGAGIIGSIYGWALAEGGHEVVHLVRPGRAAGLREGLALDVFDRRKGRPKSFRGLYRLKAVEALSTTDGFALIVSPVKHYALVQTLEEIAPCAGAADFLLLTQNWQGTKEVDAILPRTRYVYGDAKAGGTFWRSTLVAALKALDIGPPEGEPSTLTKKVAELFASAGIPTRTHPDMLHYLWVQFAVSGGPWAALVHAGNFDVLVKDRRLASLALEAGRECLQIVQRRGVDLGRYPETRPFLTNSTLLGHFYGWMFRRMFLHDEYTKRCSAHALGDPVEVKAFYDDLVGTGRALGVAMPVMESLAEDIRRFASTVDTKCGYP